MNYQTIIYVSLFVFVLVILYVIGLYLNNKTEIPDECDIPSLKCEHCKSTTCKYKNANEIDHIKKDIKSGLKDKD